MDNNSLLPSYSKKKNITKKFKRNFIFINKDNLKIELNKKINSILNKKKNLEFKDILSNENKIEKENSFLKTMKLID